MKRIEKRVPFGFRGLWGKLYQRFHYQESDSAPYISEDSDVIEYDKVSYVDIGQDVQFKEVTDGTEKQLFPTQTAKNAVTDSAYRIVQTTDAYFDDKKKEFECIADFGDIVYLFNSWWVVDSIEQKSVFTPKRQTFYYIALKNIYNEIVKE